MARKVIHDGPVNSAVMAWMRGQGIKPEDVRGYTLFGQGGEPMYIDISMYMEDVAPKLTSSCSCGSRSLDPNMHDVIACPIGSAECERANPPFVVDSNGNVWKYDAPAGGYRFGIGSPGRSLDCIRERYGIADVQPKHATCILTIGPHGPISCVCGDECPKPWANPPFVATMSGNVWTYDAERGGYRLFGGGAARSLDYLRERYRIAKVQPKHATCQNATSPADTVLKWVCGAKCPKSWPARVRDFDGNEFAHQGEGVYRLQYLFTYTLDEIGAHTVIEE